jgi:hypothetical protein
MMVTAVEYVLRSITPTWDYAAWEQLPNDGIRYTVQELFAGAPDTTL